MKKLPLVTVHRIFTVAAALLFLGFLGFLAYLYVAFNGVLIGDVSVDTSADVLAKLNDRQLKTASARLETRADLPDIPADLPDPYDASRGTPPPPPPPPGAPLP